MALFCTWTTLCVIMLGHIQSFNSAGGPFVRLSQWHSQQWFSQCNARSKTKLQRPSQATFQNAVFQSPLSFRLALALCSPILCDSSWTESFSLHHTWIHEPFVDGLSSSLTATSPLYHWTHLQLPTKYKPCTSFCKHMSLCHTSIEYISMHFNTFANVYAGEQEIYIC